MVHKLIHSRAALWALMALPSLPMMAAFFAGTPDAEGRPPSEFLLHPTGEFAARFMIAAMMISPLRLIFPRSGFWLWMAARRRYFGVAAFGGGSCLRRLCAASVGW